MAWTSLTFAYGSLLTSSKMTQLYDNITALANGDSGAPDITNAAMGSGSIKQAQLNTSTGEVSTTTINAGGITLVLPGGSYGFYPQVKSSSASGQLWAQIAGATGETANTITPGTSYTTLIQMASNSLSYTAYAQQRYINSSPPYKLADGEIPLFVFVALDKDKKVVATYSADVPPWAYNGPTSVMTKPVIGSDGRLRNIRKQRRLDVDGNFSTETGEITDSIKNADMELIPTPFITPTEHVVLLDPPATHELLMLQESGQSIGELLTEGYLRVDCNTIDRDVPPGCHALPIRWRNSAKKWRK